MYQEKNPECYICPSGYSAADFADLNNHFSVVHANAEKECLEAQQMAYKCKQFFYSLMFYCGPNVIHLFYYEKMCILNYPPLSYLCIHLISEVLMKSILFIYIQYIISIISIAKQSTQRRSAFVYLIT